MDNEPQKSNCSRGCWVHGPVRSSLGTRRHIRAALLLKKCLQVGTTAAIAISIGIGIANVIGNVIATMLNLMRSFAISCSSQQCRIAAAATLHRLASHRLDVPVH